MRNEPALSLALTSAPCRISCSISSTVPYVTNLWSIVSPCLFLQLIFFPQPRRLPAALRPNVADTLKHEKQPSQQTTTQQVPQGLYDTIRDVKRNPENQISVLETKSGSTPSSNEILR